MIINFGSINIDHVYRVPTLPEPGETLASRSYEKFLGGKGINQSIAIAKSGGEVLHLGSVGQDGDWALNEIKRLGVDTTQILMKDCATGHAIIFVSDNGENQIIIDGGANQTLEKAMVDDQLSCANPNTDWVLLQNETNLAETIIESASKLGFRIAYAAAPFVAETVIKLLPKVTLLALNAIEAKALAHALDTDESNIPVKQLLITRGEGGSELWLESRLLKQPAFRVAAVDTTGAGDTFLGSFLSCYDRDNNAHSALEYAAAASALQVMRAGAALAIPDAKDVHQLIQSQAALPIIKT